MKRFFLILIALSLVLTLGACGSKTEAPAAEVPPVAPPMPETPVQTPAEEAPPVPEDTPEPMEIEIVVNGETEPPAETPAEAPTEPTAEPEVPEEVPADAAPVQPHPLEAHLPAHWAGRYVLQEANGEVRLYCKAAYGQGEPMDGWLFSLTTLQDAVTLPEYCELGLQDGKTVVMTLPPDYLTLSQTDVQAEYLSLCGDIAGLIDTLRSLLDPIAEPEPAPQPSPDPAQYTSDLTNLGYGVYQLSWNGWSADSQNAHVYRNGWAHDILVVTADGRAFFKVGMQNIWGTVRAYAGPGEPPAGWPFWLIELNGSVYHADMLQLVLSVQGMPAVTLADGQLTNLWHFNWIGSDCERYLPPEDSQEQQVID